MNNDNSKGVENSPNLLQDCEAGTIVVEGTETSPDKIMAKLRVASVSEPESKDKEGTVMKGVTSVKQKCLFSNSDERKGALEKILLD